MANTECNSMARRTVPARPPVSPVSTGTLFFLTLGLLPRDVHTHIACALASEMPRAETIEMAVNSVKESLPSLPDEPHPLNYFPFFKGLIGRPKLVPANADVCRLAALLV